MGNVYFGVKLNIGEATKYLSTVLDVQQLRHVEDVIAETQGIPDFKRYFLISQAVVAATAYCVDVVGKLDKDRAIDIGVTFLDKLLDFSGIIGGPLELVDAYILKMILDAAYEAVRNRKMLSADDFKTMLSGLFSKY